LANEASSAEMVTADDVSEPLKLSDAEMSELNSSGVDSPSSVIAADNATLVGTSVQPPGDDQSVVTAAVSDAVESSAAELVVGTQSELVSSSPSKLVIDTSVDANTSCDVPKADDAQNLGSADVDSVAVCETVDETCCDDVVAESLPPCSENPVTFPAPPTDLGEFISTEDAIDPGGMQLDVAECVEIGETAD